MDNPTPSAVPPAPPEQSPPVSAAPLSPPPGTAGNSAPPPHGGNKKILLIIVSVIVLIIVGVVGFSVLNSQMTSQEVVISPTSVPTVEPTVDPLADWETYVSSESGFTMQYPPEVEVSVNTEGKTVNTSFSQVGPSQKEGTEFYDGISLVITSGLLNGETLEALAEAKAGEMGEHSQITKTVAPIMVNGMSGFSYSFEGLGQAEVIYLPNGTTEYIEITNGTVDPTGKDFANTVEQMLATFTITN